MEILDFTKLKPANYNRKSSESEDKQALSLMSQEEEAIRIAEFYRLPPFVAIYREAKSAKKEANRAEFARMLQDISAGEIDSIVCWKPDRLARNMTEGGQIIDLLSSGVLKAIITPMKVYYPWDNVLLLSVEFGQGHQFVKDLSVNVKRGQKTKASNGTPHGVAALGFLNDRSEEKGNRKWKVDEVRLGKIKILLDMFLTGTHSAGRLHRHAIDTLELTTVPRKRLGGALIPLSRMYEILADPIYAGFFYYGGERYELASDLPRLITEEQHEKVKRQLAKKNIPKIQHHITTFAGFIVSDEGDALGQDLKYQLICDCKKKFAYRSRTHCPVCEVEIAQLQSPKYLEYIFYYNVRKKKSGIEYKTISEGKVLEQLRTELLDNLSFSADLVRWSKDHIDKLNTRWLRDALIRDRAVAEGIAEFERKKARLRVMLRDEQITEGEYRLDLRDLQKQQGTTKRQNSNDWYARMNEIADTVECIRNVFNFGTVQQKRLILAKLGSNLVWNDKILSIHHAPEVEVLIQGVKRARAEIPSFEPKNFVVFPGSNYQMSPLFPIFSILLRTWDDVRTAIVEKGPIPKALMQPEIWSERP